jgi:integrating conjugative element protein (TIGR03758 family)
MPMSAAQTAAFKAASGNIDVNVLYSSCVGFFLAVLFLWAPWAMSDVWSGWANEKVRHTTMGRFVIRAILLLIISIWMFAS